MADQRLLEELLAREAIRDCLFRYCRGMDRCDADLLRTVYWPDARARQLDFDGDVEGLIKWSFPQVGAMDLIQHLIGNILIQRDGDRAVSEAAFTSYHRLTCDDNLEDYLSGGRYLDRLECRGSEWRIAERLVVVDWSRQLAGPAQRNDLPFGAERLWPKDISYDWLK